VIGPGHIRAELGNVLIGRQDGRVSETEITVYKSLGIAVQDLAAAEIAFRNAQARGRGTHVAF
jgi:ornithine cyclodeaminase